jgi:hypothetical protein
MKVRVYDISSISHMLMHDGVPCDKYTATVKVGIVGKVGWASGTWYLRVYARTERALEQKLNRLRTDDVVEIDTDNLYNGGRKYGETHN